MSQSGLEQNVVIHGLFILKNFFKQGDGLVSFACQLESHRVVIPQDAIFVIFLDL